MIQEILNGDYSAMIPRCPLSKRPLRWRKRLHGCYSRNGDLLTILNAEQLIEELQDTIIEMQNAIGEARAVAVCVERLKL